MMYITEEGLCRYQAGKWTEKRWEWDQGSDLFNLDGYFREFDASQFIASIKHNTIWGKKSFPV